MYKPKLKRPADFNLFKRNVMEDEIQLKAVQPVNKRLDPAHLMVPIKMLETPENKSKESSHILTPLYIHSHKYPKEIQKMISSPSGETNRGIGGYRQVNWYFQGPKISFWTSGKDYHVSYDIENPINCVAMSQLRGCNIPSKMKNRYVLAIATGRQVKLYSLNNFTLVVHETGLLYELSHSMNIDKLKFVDKNKLVIVGDTGHLMIVEFGQNQGKKIMYSSFFKKFLAIGIDYSTSKVEEIVYTPKKIFVLMTEFKPKGWFKSIIQNIFEGESQPVMRFRYVQIYDIEQNRIIRGGKISQEELNRKVKQYVPTFQGNFELQTIYLDTSTDKDGQLGLVTTCGCFFSLKNIHLNLSRQPLFMPNINQLGQCQLVSLHKLENGKNPKDQGIIRSNIICSLGYDNLTLMEDSLLCIEDKRIDGVLSTLPMGELVEKTEFSLQKITEKTRQWGLYTFNNYFTIKKLPLRHFVATLLYMRSNITNEYMGLHCNEQKFNQIIEKYIKIITPETFLRLLIQIIISEERYLSVNQYFIDMIESELKDEKPKSFKDWPFVLDSNVLKVEIFLKERAMQQIWFMLLDLQHRNVVSSLNRYNQNIYQSNNLWLTMKNIYHQIVSPIFGMNPDKFKANHELIEDIGDSLRSIDKFFEEKDNYEKTMKGINVFKLESSQQYKSQSSQQQELDITQSSIRRQYQMNWLPQQSKRSIVTRSLNEYHSILEQKIKNAFQATGIFLMIYFNMEDYLCRSIGNNLETYTRASIPPFKEVLASREQQRYIKKILLAQVNFEHLSELNKRMPLFNLEKDLLYLECRNKIKMENLEKDKINLDELASTLSSDYFEDLEKIFQESLNLQLRVLGLYQEKLQTQKLTLIPSNTLKQRILMAKACFPEDEQQILKFKRAHLDKQFDLTIQEQEKCISKIVSNYREAKQKSSCQRSEIFEKTLLLISQKPHLIQHMEQQLKQKCLTRQLHQLQRIKPQKQAFERYSGRAILKGQHYRRQLFPRPSYI